MSDAEGLVPIDDRLAELATRITDADPRERAYASLWLDRLWNLRDALLASQEPE